MMSLTRPAFLVPGGINTFKASNIIFRSAAVFLVFGRIRLEVSDVGGVCPGLLLPLLLVPVVGARLPLVIDRSLRLHFFDTSAVAISWAWSALTPPAYPTIVHY